MKDARIASERATATGPRIRRQQGLLRRGPVVVGARRGCSVGDCDVQYRVYTVWIFCGSIYVGLF